MKQKLKLNLKQKQYLARRMLGISGMVKLFETDDFKWFSKQKIEIGERDQYGWRPLIVNGEKITDLNFSCNPGWWETLTHINDYYECEWCKDWFTKREMVFKKRGGFTQLCFQCKEYLITKCCR